MEWDCSEITFEKVHRDRVRVPEHPGFQDPPAALLWEAETVREVAAS